MSNRPELPEINDFPHCYHLSITPPQTKRAVTSVLLLLHGLGDSEVPFTNLARSLALPETVAIALRAPCPIPPFFTGSDLPAFHWSDDLLFDEHTADMDADGGFSRAILFLEDILSVLVRRCGFQERDVWILGYGQGASVGLAFVAKTEKERKPLGGFGGIVAIGGGLPKETLTWIPQTPAAKLKTPVLICGGSQGTQITKGVLSALKYRFDDVRYVKWEKEGDGMPKNRDEMFPIMQFFASRLRTRAGVPDGAVEL